MNELMGLGKRMLETLLLDSAFLRNDGLEGQSAGNGGRCVY